MGGGHFSKILNFRGPNLREALHSFAHHNNWGGGTFSRGRNYEAPSVTTFIVAILYISQKANIPWDQVTKAGRVIRDRKPLRFAMEMERISAEIHKSSPVPLEIVGYSERDIHCCFCGLGPLRKLRKLGIQNPTQFGGVIWQNRPQGLHSNWGGGHFS